MDRVIVQVPMTKTLKVQAEAVARDQGFSSVQEAIRLFLTKFARRELSVSIGYPDEHLSPRAERRYAKIIQDIKSGKNVTKTDNLDQLFAGLES
ncbi:MAG: hypothetical protein Q8L37_05245 [Candidatus Gottesmanbacteria bacterium]|nr:hypothetical protein [Candidatus Gottesmanbacteria bacterium]